MDRLDELRTRLTQFRDERDWSQFHDPKNLAEAIAIEAGELLENFLWKSTDEARALTGDARERVAAEIADVLIFTTYLGLALGIDPVEEAHKKIRANETRYSIDKAKGNARKQRSTP